MLTDELRARLAIVQGDITTLVVDAIATIAQELSAHLVPAKVVLCTYDERATEIATAALAAA